MSVHHRTRAPLRWDQEWFIKSCWGYWGPLQSWWPSLCLLNPDLPSQVYAEGTANGVLFSDMDGLKNCLVEQTPWASGFQLLCSQWCGYLSTQWWKSIPLSERLWQVWEMERHLVYVTSVWSCSKWWGHNPLVACSLDCCLALLYKSSLKDEVSHPSGKGEGTVLTATVFDVLDKGASCRYATICWSYRDLSCWGSWQVDNWPYPSTLNTD